MSLYETVGSQLKEAMKSGDAAKRDVFRMLQSAMKNEAIEKMKQPQDFSDEESLVVVRRLVKQRKESVTQFESGGRADLAEKEKGEIAILEAFLPTAMPEEELTALVREAIAESGAIGKADMGKAMGVAMKKVAGRADGNAVRAMVEKILS